MSDKIFAEGSHACYHFQDLLSDDRAMMDPFFAAKKTDGRLQRILLCQSMYVFTYLCTIQASEK